MIVSKELKVERPDYDGPRINVLLQPEDEIVSLPRPKNSRQLLEILGLAEETALVARIGHINVMEVSFSDGDLAKDAVYPELLTPDRRI